MTFTNTFNLSRLILILFTLFTFLSWGRNLKSNSSEELSDLYQELKAQATAVSNLVELPPPDSVVKLTNGTKYAIVVWDTQTEQDKASFNALLSVSIPGGNQKLLFYGEQVSFSNKVGIAGKVKLKLVKDVVVMKGDVVSLIFKAKDTYAEIDCHGFDKMSLGIDLEFSRNHILKENPDGSISTERVKTSLTLQVKDFSDFLVGVNIPTFQIKGVKDLSFTASKVYLDFSDYANPPDLKLDVKYDSIFRVDSLAKLWQGVYLGQVSIKLPKFLKKDETAQRIEIGANHMVIDEYGFTGSAKVGGLVGLNKGNLGSWSFSLDSLGLVFLKDKMEAGYFGGKIRLPIGKELDTLGYKCRIGIDGSYAFSVNTLDTMSFPILKADTVKLLPNSSLALTVKDDTVKIRAILNGRMSVSAPIIDAENDARFQVGNIDFEGIEIANYSPELAVKAISFTSADKEKSPQLYDFPVTISSIKLSSDGKGVQLGITLMLNLNENFGAGGGFTLHGKIYKKDGKVKYEFDRTVLNSLKIDVTVTKFKLKGEITAFEKDSQFGTGFKGNINMELKLSDKTISVGVGTVFGKIRNTRYWFADGKLTGIKIPVVTGVNITGFSGGAYSRMRKDFNTKHPLSKTLTGQRYLPDSLAGLGFQAGVILGIPDAQTAEGRLILELAFNKGGGLRRIFLLGEVECMVEQAGKVDESNMLKEVAEELATEAVERAAEDHDKDIPLLKHFEGKDNYGDKFSPKPVPKDVLKASMIIDMNLDTDELFANFKAYVSVDGGSLRGAYANGLAGEGDIYFGKDKWHMCLGKPSYRLELLVDGMANFNTYFMMGNDIEGSPAPPVEISQILQLDASKLDYMRDLNALKEGKGIAFGASFGIETGERPFSIFYYRLSAGGGFDIMLKDYGDNAYCEGRTGRLGLNGWMANGQAYAYMQGSVGLQVRLAFLTGRYEILSVGAAALLQAKLPNPSWMRGIIGGNYNILNGLVKGKCRIEAELGQECKARRSAGELDSVKIIAQLTPDNGKTDVSVFAKPQAVFNIPIDEVFSIEDLQYPGTYKKFKAVVKTLDIRHKNQDKIVGEMQWNDDHTTVAFKSSEILAPQKEFIFEVAVGFEQEINGQWQAYKDAKGQSPMERKDVAFKTGDAPDHIPMENLEFTYPVLGQKNFYKDMTKTGYIQLIRGQAYLFTDPKYSPSIMVSESRGQKSEIPVKYDIGAKNIVYTLPTLQTDRIYSLSFENMPKDRNAAVDKNVSTQSKEVVTASSDTGSTATVSTKLATGVVEEVQGKVLLAYKFRTSVFETLEKKIGTNLVLGNMINSVDYHGEALSVQISQPNEPFDASELDADKNLISFEFNFRDHAWFADKLKGYLYQKYPASNGILLDRDTSVLGWIPCRDVTFSQSTPLENLSADEEAMDKVTLPGNTYYKITGNFHRTMYQDYYGVRSQIADLYSKGRNLGSYVGMLTDSYPGLNITRGFVYPLEVYYQLPWERKKRVSTIKVIRK